MYGVAFRADNDLSPVDLKLNHVHGEHDPVTWGEPYKVKKGTTN